MINWTPWLTLNCGAWVPWDEKNFGCQTFFLCHCGLKKFYRHMKWGKEPWEQRSIRVGWKHNESGEATITTPSANSPDGKIEFDWGWKTEIGGTLIRHLLGCDIYDLVADQGHLGDIYIEVKYDD